MTTSGGNGGADNWGWGVGPDSTPAADGASNTEFPPQSGQTPYTPQASHTGPGSSPGAAHSGYAAQPGSPAAAQRPTKPRPKWVPILALLIIVPLGIAAAFFGVTALSGSDEDDGLYVESIAGSDSTGGSPTTDDSGSSAGAADSDDSGSGDSGSGSGSDDSDDSDTSDEGTGTGSSDLRDAPSEGNDFAKPMSGQYSGEVSQVGVAAGARSATYTALIEIADDASTIDYPSLNCSGRLVFEGMCQAPGFVEGDLLVDQAA